jgi:hypothetical protein
MNELEKLVVKLTMDSSEYTDGIEKAEKKSSGLGKTLLTGLVGTTAMVGATAAGAFTGMAKFIGTTIDPANDLAETVSKVGVVFGNNAKGIESWGQTAARSMGMSTNTALAAAGTYGNLFSAMGIGSKATADMSTGLVQLAADLASFNNVDPTQVLDALRSGLSSNTQPLKSLGVNLNQAMVEAKALEMGLWDGTGAIDAAAKAQATYSLVLEQTKLAQGDYARTADGLANTQRSLAATWEDLKGAIGTSFLPMVTQGAQALLGFAGGLRDIAVSSDTMDVKMSKVGDLVSTTVNGVLNDLPGIMTAGVKMVSTLLTGVVTALPTIIPAIVRLMLTVVNAIIGLMPIILDAGMQILIQIALGIATALPSLIPAIVLMMLSLVQIIVENLPMLIDAALQLILGLVKGINAAMPVLLAQMPVVIAAVVSGLLACLPEIIMAALELILALADGLIQAIPALILAIPPLIEAIITALLENLPLILEAGMELIKGLISDIGEMIPKIKQAGEDMMAGFKEGMKSMFASIWAEAKEFADKVVELVKGALKSHSPSMVFFAIGRDTMLGLSEGIAAFADEPLNLSARVSSDLADSVSVRGVNQPLNGAGSYFSLQDMLQAIKEIRNPSAEENARALVLAMQQSGIV